MRPTLKTCLALTVLCLPLTAFAQATGDLATLQGNWKTTIGRDPEITLTLRVEEDLATLSFSRPEGETVTLKGKIKIDQNVSPRSIDWVDFKRPDGTDAPANLGIYKIEDKKLIVLNGGPGGTRPTEFPALDFGSSNYFTFERN